jgi:Cu-processing system permease protein
VELTKVVTLAAKEVADARRRRWLVLFALAFAVLATALAWLGLSGLPGYAAAGFGRTGASLVNLVLLVVPLMGLTLGALALAQERERGTLLYLLAQPITPGELFAGKFAGLALALLDAIFLGFGIAAVPIAWKGGTSHFGAFLALVLLAYLLAVASLALGLLISALSDTSALSLGVALFCWLVLVFLGDLGVMGTALALRLGTGELLAAVLLNPLQVFKVSAILAVRGSLEVLGPAGAYALRRWGEGLQPLLVGILVAWTAIPLTASYLALRRRGAV